MSANSCAFCRATLSIDDHFRYLIEYGLSCCDTCARLISDAYSIAHSGVDLSGKDGRDCVRRISAKTRKQILSRDRVCISCGSNEKLEVDHIIPKSKGGPDSHDNLQVLCRKCNSEKGTFDNQQFFFYHDVEAKQ